MVPKTKTVRCTDSPVAEPGSISPRRFERLLSTVSGQPYVRPISLLELAWLMTVIGFALASVTVARHQGWAPVGDDAVVVTRSRDVLSTSPPMLGMPTSLVLDSGVWTYHPGPLLFAWLAPFVVAFGRVTGGALGAAMLNLTAIVVSWWCVRSMFGPRTGIVAGTIGLLVATSFVPIYLPLNSSLAATGTIAVFLAAWAVLMRVPRAAYALIFFASMTAQSHLAYAVVTLSVAAPILGWHVVNRWRGAPGTELRESAQAIAPVVGFTIALWIGSLLDRGRNLVQLIGQPAAADSLRGPSHALATVTSALGKLPIEFSRPGLLRMPPVAKHVDQLFTGEVSVAAVLVGALALAVIGWASIRGARSVRAGSMVLALAPFSAVGEVLFFPWWGDVEVVEDGSLGGGEAVESDAVVGVGESESLERGEGVSAGG